MSFRAGQSAVVYLRVSTARQGHSGLGLEAQATAVRKYAATSGLAIVAEYVEVESGKRDDRPQLTAALAACRLHRATLVIAKLDRLARNMAFIANLMDGGVEFVACDMPHANRLTLHLFAAIAEHEREMISQRTKAALQAAKARGVRLGNPNGAAALINGCKTAAQASVAIRQAKAARHAAAVEPLASELAEEGLNNREIARELNRRGVPSQSGRGWYAEQIRRTLQRLQVSHAA